MTPEEFSRTEPYRTDELAQRHGLRPCLNTDCSTVYYTPKLDKCPRCSQ